MPYVFLFPFFRERGDAADAAHLHCVAVEGHFVGDQVETGAHLAVVVECCAACFVAVIDKLLRTGRSALFFLFAEVPSEHESDCLDLVERSFFFRSYRPYFHLTASFRRWSVPSFIISVTSEKGVPPSIIYEQGTVRNRQFYRRPAA